MFITMAICNTVVVAQRSGTGENGKESTEIIYEAESSDEYALVQVSLMAILLLLCLSLRYCN